MPPRREPLVAAAFADAARTMYESRTMEESLDCIVRVAVDTVPGFDHCGVTLVHRSGKVETMAASDPIVSELDSAQYALGEGPCFDTLRDSRNVVVHDMTRERRWPRYVKDAIEAGIKSQIGLHLYADGHTVGALCLYRTTGQGIDPEAEGIAEIFATHAALALGRTRTVNDLNTALATRKVIGQAIGLVMERHQIDEKRAFDFLIRVSSTSHIKVRDLAEELVTQSNDRYGSKAT